MKIGVRMMASWLKGEDDLRFLQQIGVDCVDINLGLLSSYRNDGQVDSDELGTLVDHLARFDLVIERAANLGDLFAPIYLDEPGAEAATARVQRNIEVLGAHGVPIMAVPPFSPRSLAAEDNDSLPQQDYKEKYGDSPPPFDLEFSGGRRTTRQRRGGYGHPRFDLDPFEGATPLGDAPLERDTLWQRLTDLYRVIAPVAECAGVLLTMHGNDPPLREAWGQPQLVTHHDDFERLFTEVPSPANGMTYCVGTRHESGEDVLEGIRRFGRQGRIFHVHFRNVEGTLPANRGYAETLLDDGDLDMGVVLRTFHEVGYRRAIDFDHVLHLAGDTPNGHASVALAVGYIQGLMNGLPVRSAISKGGKL